MPVSVIIAAYNSAPSIGATVRAARQIAEVAEIIVVDDGSSDGTAAAARDAAADRVLRLSRNRGKGAAMAAGVSDARHSRLLFLDADLGQSAAHAGPLLDAIAGEPAMAVAVFPRQRGGGGFGFARGLAYATIRLLGGIRVSAPLSGQRAMPAAFVQRVGLASRFAVETALTVEAAYLNVPVIEVPLPLEHQPTGRTLSGIMHRVRQFSDILRYSLLAAYGLGWPALSAERTAARVIAWLFGLSMIIAVGAATVPRTSVLLTVVALCGVLTWLPSLWVSTIWLRLRKPNYLGRSLPAAAGLLFPLVALPAAWFSPMRANHRLAAVIVIGIFGAAGLLDDLLSSRRQARGLRGHLKALLRGRLTTGAVKAIAGMGAGIAAAAVLFPDRPVAIAVNALLIPLAANAVNLLDLRPSRAIKGFGLLCVPSLAWSPDSLLLLGPMLALAAVAAPAEFAGRVMLGDVGANVLGAIAGLTMAAVLPTWAGVAAVLALAGMHLLCERVSLTDLIQRSRVLFALDRLGTAHLEPLAAREAVRG